MISNEMRLQHRCNLSGKISAGECALLPRVSASSESSVVSLVCFFFLLSPGSLNASFFYEEHIVFLLISCTRFILLQGYVVNI